LGGLTINAAESYLSNLRQLPDISAGQRPRPYRAIAQDKRP
jgi:hypothetical protein